MKSQNKILQKFSLLLFITLFIACSKDDSPSDPNGNGSGELAIREGLSPDDFETYEGEIGINISVRDIARKGYSPSQAEITVNAASGDFNRTLPIDPLLSIVDLSYVVSELSEAAKAELTEGVNISIKIVDQNGTTLVDQEISSISFTPGNSEIEVEDESLPDLLAEVDLKEDVQYHIQTVASNSDEINGSPETILHTTGDVLVEGAPLIASELDDLDYTSSQIGNFHSFYFEKIPGETNVYNIYVKNIGDTNRKHYLYNNDGRWLCIQSGWNWSQNGGNTTDAATRNNFKFRIERVQNGLFTITPINTNKALKFTQESTIRRNPSTLNTTTLDFKGFKSNDDTSSADPVYFRILSLDIDWDIQILESKFLTPILPPASTSFAYNSTLVNCSSGSLSQEVGIEQTTQSIAAAGWSESMTLSTSKTYELSLTLETEVSASFRGFGATARRSITGGYKVNKEVTRTRASSESFTNSQTVTLSSKRIQTVPSGSATLISDNYQTYTNINIPFVQRYRIKGNYPEGGLLSGKEITTQFAFNQFTGVITQVGVDFIEVTVRGTTTFDKLIDTETIARDVPSNCGG